MWTALLFGFTNHILPESPHLHFHRLHIFLFNLCAGGSILIAWTTKKNILSKEVLPFLIISLVFAFAAFAGVYSVSIICAFALSIITERIRIKKFGFLPWMFFSKQTKVYNKFHNASLICLATGLLISACVIINNKYLHFVEMEKLKLDTFFLGFSFPLSLITMSVMFRLTQNNKNKIREFLKNTGFWAVNLGVIIFFMFILFNMMISQLVIAIILFAAIILILYIFASDKFKKQQKTFLLSGMFFLLFTGISGIAYILLEMTPFYNTNNWNELLLRMHSFTSLYGWNLSGLAVIIRFEDFPIELHSKTFISLHWLTALFFGPFGEISKVIAILAIISYALIIKWIFFSSSKS